jgi:vancomycin permeability regulator SanA
MKIRRFFRKNLMVLENFLSNWKKIVSLLLVMLLSVVVFIGVIHFWIHGNYSDKKYSNIDEAPKMKVAIVFGAGLDESGTGDILSDRVQTGIDLYEAGKVQKIIMSGDNRTEFHDEPSAMMKQAQEAGVPDYALQPDYAGRRTYDTCLRAKKIFKVDEAILVTQDFHMDRALYTCDSVGIDVVGVSANRHNYKGGNLYALRDYFALVKAVWEINVDQPDNVVLGDVIEL